MESKALDLGTPEHNAMIKDIGHVCIDFSAIPMYLPHIIQHVALDELKERQHAVFEQLKHPMNIVASLKTKAKEMEQKS